MPARRQGAHRPFAKGQVLSDPWFGEGHFLVVDVDDDRLVLAQLPHVLEVAIPVPEPAAEALPAEGG